MPVTDGGKGGLDRVCRSQMLPVFLWEVVERQELVSILLEAVAGCLVLGLVLLQEVVEGFRSRFTGLRHPDFLESGLGLRLNALGHLVQHIRRFMHPAALLPCSREDLW